MLCSPSYVIYLAMPSTVCYILFSLLDYTCIFLLLWIVMLIHLAILSFLDYACFFVVFVFLGHAWLCSFFKSNIQHNHSIHFSIYLSIYLVFNYFLLARYFVFKLPSFQSILFSGYFSFKAFCFQVLLIVIFYISFAYKILNFSFYSSFHTNTKY